MYEKYGKRLIDIVLSLLGLVVLSPVFLILIIAIKMDSRGPILFKQVRTTKDRREFVIYKFRTMRVDTPHNTPTHLLVGAESYITRVGGFLRKTSLDELPQLINILKGDMTIIGPRPSLPTQTDLLDERQKYDANRVKTGLTGLAQISGRDELPICEKAQYDGEYCKKITFLSDTKIFVNTFLSVLKHDGIQEGKS